MGGVLGTTRGLVGEFGMNRVRDTPIAEMGLIGTAVGAAATGLRPIAELMFMDFLGTSLDPLLNQAAKLRYMFGGKAKVPLTVRTVSGAGHAGGGPAFAIALLDDDGHPRAEDRDSFHARRGQGLVAGVDSRRRPGESSASRRASST